MNLQKTIRAVFLLILCSAALAQAEQAKNIPLLGVVALVPPMVTQSAEKMSVATIPSRAQTALLKQASATSHAAGSANPESGWVDLRKFYIGAGGGRSELNNCIFSDRSLETPITGGGFTGTQACEDEEFGWKAYAGYEYSPYLSAEVGYGQIAVDYQVTARNLTRTFPAPPGGEAPASITGISYIGLLDLQTIFISGAFRIPFSEQVQAYVKVGAHRWDSSANREFASSAGALATPEEIRRHADAVAEVERVTDQHGFDYLYGLGLQYRFKNGFGMRAEWERYALSDVLQSIEFLSFNVDYKFQ